jgi:hypothetical protein
MHNHPGVRVVPETHPEDRHPGGTTREDTRVAPFGLHLYMGMSQRIQLFMKLQALLKENSVLYDSKHVKSTKKLGILLYMLITSLSNQKLQQIFQQLASTISITINQMVSGLVKNLSLI